MYAYIFRKILYNIPVYLGIILIMMAALRVNDPVAAYIGKNVTPESIALKRHSMGLDRPFLPIATESESQPFDPNVKPWFRVGSYVTTHVGSDGVKRTTRHAVGIYSPGNTQYFEFLWRIARLDFGTKDKPYNSWQYESENVGEKLRQAIPPTVKVTVPTLILTSSVAIFVGMLSAYFRGTWLDRTLMFFVVLGMSVSVVVFIVIGQTIGSGGLKELLGFEVFASSGYEPGIRNWITYCALPVIIGVVVGIGYDTRFYRAVMVEETSRDYITTAIAKGATKRKIMFVHMLKNAMIPVITRIMITIPFLVTGSIVMEYQFRIPGMGKLLIDALSNKDFPIIQTFSAVFALIFIVTNILTDVLYALVDPRVRLS